MKTYIASGRLSAEPFHWQGVATSPQSMQACAELYSANRFPAAIKSWAQQPPAGNKIRVGYLSSDFRAQATARLLVGVLEEHDKSRFEIHAFDNGWDDKSDMRRRVGRMSVQT